MSAYVGMRTSRPSRWALLAAAVVGLAVAHPAVGIAAPPDAPPAVVDQAPDEASAQAAAKKSGKPVQIAGRTTQTDEYFALPNGSFSWRQHQRPARVRQGANWTPVDIALVKRPDGTVAPKAAAVDLTLSGGGVGSSARPLVKVAHQDAEVGLGWDADLPEPVLVGPTATYPEVLPGVDLKVTADVTGFSQVLVVKSAEAARNPKLAKVTFKSHTKNAQVRLTQSKGRAAQDKPNLEVLDGKGTTVFTGDATRMWDSSGVATEGARLLGEVDGAKTAAMATEVTAQSVSIIPDQAFLADEATSYPVYLDPDYSCVGCSKAHHVVVQSGYPTAKNYDAWQGKLSDLKAGYQTTDSSGVSRSYVEMNTVPIFGKTIHWASLNTTLLYSWHDADAKPTELWLTNPITPDTMWSKQPDLANVPGVNPFQSSSNVTNKNQAPNVPMNFGATAAVQAAATYQWHTTNFMLKGEHEGATWSWRRFGLNPYLEVHYNSTPNNPSVHRMQNGALPCVKGPDRPWVSTRTPVVQAMVSDPDGGSLGVRVATSGGPYGADVPGSYRENIGGMPWLGTPGQNQGALAQFQIPEGWITTDGIHKWAMQVTDGEASSPRWDWDCEFYVDTVVPLAPRVNQSGTPPVNQGDKAEFHASVDMAADIRDIARFVYTTDGSEPSPQGSPSVTAGWAMDVNTGKWSAYMKFTSTALHANQNLIKVRAVNKAGTPGPNGTCRSPLTTVGTACAYTVAPLTSTKFLKGAWSLDDRSGSTASDQVAALNPGETVHPFTLNGGVSWDEGYSRGNSWTQFDAFGAKDGTRGGLRFFNNGHLETTSKVVDTSASFTVSVWANLAGTGADRTVLSHDGGQVSGFFLRYWAEAGKWAFSTAASDAGTTSLTHATSADNAAVPQLNVWTHLVGSYDATTKQITLYVDGKKMGSATLPGPMWSANGGMVTGAAKWPGRTHHFSGLIDDVQAWQRLLSPQEVRDLASVAVPRAGYGLAEGAAEKLVTGATGDQDTGDFVPAPMPSLQGYWKFDENTGTTVTDSSNNGSGYENNLITTNATWVAGKSGSALRYSGQTGSYSHSAASAVDTSQSFTASAWVKIEDLADHQAVVGQTGTHVPGFQIRYSADVKAWVFGRAVSNTVGSAIEWAGQPDSVGQTGRWTLVTGVYNKQTQQIQIYVDGKLAGARTFSGVPWDATGRVTVGAYDFNSTPEHFFRGTIDNVQLWQRALTASQVAALAGLSYGDSVWGQTSAIGAPTGNVSQTADSEAAYAHFDAATGSRVTWPRPGNLRTDRSYTIEAWVKNDHLAGGTGTAVSISDPTTMPVGLNYHIEWGRWSFLITDTPGQRGRALLSNAAPTEGKWTHLAGTYDFATGTACFYVNGQLQTTEVDTAGNAQNVGGCSTGVVSRNNGGSIVAGAGYWNGQLASPWRGAVAGVRVFSGIRTEDQMKDDRTTDDPGALFEVRH